MVEYPYLVLIFILIGVIAFQAAERFFYAQQMNHELEKLLSKLTAVIMSKNVLDYTQMVKTEKGEKPKPQGNPDEVLITDATDAEFDKFIENANK